MIAAILLAITPAPAPSITVDCNRDISGRCILNTTPSPLFYPSEADRLAGEKIYQAYVDCYWQTLSAHPAFGVADRERAMAAFQDVAAACMSQRTSADRRFDALLADGYGDERRRLIIRDAFRSSMANAYLLRQASEVGKRAAMEAMFDVSVGSQSTRTTDAAH